MECSKQWTDEKGQKHTKRGCMAGIEDFYGRRIMKLQPDFREQEGMVEEVTRHGHLVMFYPKFHCELNWIEYFWGDGKQRTHQLCDRLHLQWVEEGGVRSVREYRGGLNPKMPVVQEK